MGRWLASALVLAGSWCHADATVAVATNFAVTAERLQNAFSNAGGATLTLVNGSTGKLYAQITRGAPFDLFLAADAKRPLLLVQQQLAVAGSRVTYAYGALVLWRTATTPKHTALDQLKQGAFRRLAMANPDLAPYGNAAQQTLAQLGLLQRFKDRIVRGQNIGQTFAMVRSGNAELGFIAAAQMSTATPEASAMHHWRVPAQYHDPITQQLVLLEHGAHNDTAKAFARFLQTQTARAIIQADGYRLDAPEHNGAS